MQSINRKKLLKELESVKKGLASKDLIEQSTSFIFINKKIVTYNDEIFAMSPTELELEGVVSAEPLLKLLNKITDEEITITEHETEIQIKGKKFSSGITFDSEIKLPIDDAKTPKKMKSLPKNFTLLAKLACLTASSSLHEPLLTCVHIYEDKIESCDNDRITICNLDADFKFNVIVPAKNLYDLCDADLTHIAVDDAWIHFKTSDDVYLATRLYNEKFLDVQQFIPSVEEKTVITFPDNTAEILARADIFSKDITSQEKNVQIHVQKKKMKVISRNETGWFTETIDTKCKEKFDFTINLEFLTDILKITNEISLIGNTLFFETENSIHLVQLDEEE